ncbi:hypothetical protein BD413DRAFT_605658 [Trametes elegans]|nr:hypothetical protein BD413DRAFT_605658 [Trametes elegans]
MLGHSKSATLALLLLFLGVAYAAPLVSEKRTVNTSVRVPRDGDNLGQPITVQTKNTIQTAAGPMDQVCTITLEPITGDNGEPLVRETKSCKIETTSSGNNAGTGSDSSSSSSADAGQSMTDSPSATSSSDSASATESASSSNGCDSCKSMTDQASSTDSSASASQTDASASAVPGSALSSGATDSAAASATASASASASASATGGGAVSAGGFSSIQASGVSSATAASGSAGASGTAVGDVASGSATSAADTAATSAAAFQLPGTKLQVLPIGLGVFAGISVIALIVVGLVTYERTKYRRAFRQRKLAESGASMGYGGMA